MTINPESGIQRTIVAYLRYSGFLVFEFAKPGTHRKLAGVLPEGFPDLLAIRDGKHVFIEMKAPKKNRSPKQYDMHRLMWDNGAVVVVARSLEDCQEIMRGLGFDMPIWVN